MLRPQMRRDAWQRYCRPTRHSKDLCRTRDPNTQQPRVQDTARWTIIITKELSLIPSAISWLTLVNKLTRQYPRMSCHSLDNKEGCWHQRHWLLSRSGGFGSFCSWGMMYQRRGACPLCSCSCLWFSSSEFWDGGLPVSEDGKGWQICRIILKHLT